MGYSVVLEPLVVVILLFGGAWINRNRGNSHAAWSVQWSATTDPEEAAVDGRQARVANRLDTPSSGLLSPSLLPVQEQRSRQRQLRVLGYTRSIDTPNTAVFRNRLLSRVLKRFPFLVEAWYWALIYWVYQIGRAVTALTIQEGTVDTARKHALQLIDLERKLQIFWEVPIQRFFMGHPTLMRLINWLYSFIHIPATISFLVGLYYYTITSNRMSLRTFDDISDVGSLRRGPRLYEARRRTMAICNLMAFIVFTVWPCMPPRLLSDDSVQGENGEHARSFGFVDTVHGSNGAVSVWTANKFCNQYAAMPSLHFGYSLLVGVTIMTVPLPPQHTRSRSVHMPFFNQSHPHLAPQIKLPSMCRLLCLILGFAYPFSILVAIISTANHFILDAVAGALICAVGWSTNGLLLNLLPIEDWFLWGLRIHKPEPQVISVWQSSNVADSTEGKT